MSHGLVWRGITQWINQWINQVIEIREDWHIYMTDDGRISMAGITSDNVQYVAQSIHSVIG